MALIFHRQTGREMKCLSNLMSAAMMNPRILMDDAYMMLVLANLIYLGKLMSDENLSQQFWGDKEYKGESIKVTEELRGGRG